MSKFAGRPTAAPRAPISTLENARSRTYEGGMGWNYDPKSELFTLAAVNMVSEDTFYESGAARDDRYEKLVRDVTRDDPAWVAAFVPYLRNVMNMRSAPIVMAAEYVAAGGPHGAAVVDSAMARADEPAEMLAYWHARYGRRVPKPIKRGVARAVTRLYNERAALRYDGNERPWRMGDVIELVHPKPKAPWQNALFRFLLDKRHHSDGEAKLDGEAHLDAIASDFALRTLPDSDRRSALGGNAWNSAGWSWERLSGWLPGGMDAQAWEAVIPTMGYMALLRNLRKFDEAKISESARKFVLDKLTNPEEVARSRQFPYRFFSAYMEIASFHWAQALETALNLSLGNVPHYGGRSLILIDTSASMRNSMSKRSKRMPVELAALFGGAIAQRSDAHTFVLYATNGEQLNGADKMPLLRLVDTVRSRVGAVGHGTNTWEAVNASWDGHDRIIILSDLQAHDSYGSYSVPDVPIFTFNLGGYHTANMPLGEKNRYMIAGLNDAAFKLLPMLEERRDGSWPFI